VGPGAALRAHTKEGESVLRTDDLFLGAFALVRGGELQSLELHGANGRSMAVFCIEGPGVKKAEREYYSGAATVDLRLLKLEVRRLKDLAFDAIRKEEERDASDERRDRAHQVRERARGGRR
jgi:hypothetical protein